QSANAIDWFQCALVLASNLRKDHDTRKTLKYILPRIGLLYPDSTPFTARRVRLLFSQPKITVISRCRRIYVKTPPAGQSFYSFRFRPEEHGIIRKILPALPNQFYRQCRFSASGWSDEQDSHSILGGKPGRMETIDA